MGVIRLRYSLDAATPRTSSRRWNRASCAALSLPARAVAIWRARTSDLEQMMGDVLDAMMSIFVGYRAFLVSRATRIPLRLRRSWSAPARNISH